MHGRLIEHRLGDILLLGYSVAGEETVVAAPELNVCFDIGNAPAEMIAIDHVLLSHGHMDHAAGLAYYFSQRNFVGNSPGCVIAPAALVDPIRDLMRVWGRIEGHVSPARIIGMKPGDSFDVRKGLVVRAFDINHGVASLGFVLVDVRHKLKPEFAGKTGPELVGLKKQGVQIEHTVEVPLVAYCGDTAEGAWIDNPLVKNARVLILECTFFEADHVQRARLGHHLHVRDVARLLPKLQNEHIVLTHLTRRTSLRAARAMLGKLASAEHMKRVVFLMDNRRGRPARHTAPHDDPPGEQRADATAGQSGPRP